HVSMKNNIVKAGAARIDVGPGTQLDVSGTGKHATLEGQVNLNGGSLNHGGTQVKLGPGSAHLHATYSRDSHGAMHVSTKVSNVNARVAPLNTEHARRKNDHAPDRLDLANTQLKNGELNVDATFKSQKGQSLPH